MCHIYSAHIYKMYAHDIYLLYKLEAVSMES